MRAGPSAALSDLSASRSMPVPSTSAVPSRTSPALGDRAAAGEAVTEKSGAPPTPRTSAAGSESPSQRMASGRTANGRT